MAVAQMALPIERRNGASAIASGGTGCTGASTLTRTVRSRASGSASTTSTVHTNSPVSRSTACTAWSLVDRSKSRIAWTSPTMKLPYGHTSPCFIGIAPLIAIVALLVSAHAVLGRVDVELGISQALLGG